MDIGWLHHATTCSVFEALFDVPERLHFVWSADRCTDWRDFEINEMVSIKDLRKLKRLGLDLKRMVAIDDSPEASAQFRKPASSSSMDRRTRRHRTSRRFQVPQLALPTTQRALRRKARLAKPNPLAVTIRRPASTQRRDPNIPSLGRQAVSNFCHTPFVSFLHALTPSSENGSDPVNPLILRSELPPEDAVVVIRGGEMNSVFVRKTAEDSFSVIGIFTVSVALALDMSPEELCQKDRRISRYGKVRFSTVGRLRSLGFAFLPTLTRPHYDIVLPDISDDTLDRLELAFDLTVERPGSLQGGSN